MFEEKLKELFEQFSKEIEGILYYYEDGPSELSIIKEDVLIRYQYGIRNPNRGEIEYRFMVPSKLLDTKITIKSNKGRFFLSVYPGEYYFKDFQNYCVKVSDDEKTIALTQALLKDYQFNLLVEPLLEDWTLRYIDSMVVITGSKSVNTLNPKNKLTCDDLLDVYHLLIEFKKALEYHYKRI